MRDYNSRISNSEDDLNSTLDFIDHFVDFKSTKIDENHIKIDEDHNKIDIEEDFTDFDNLKDLLEHKNILEKNARFRRFLSINQLVRSENCASFLQFARYENAESQVKKILKSARFCKHRFCAMCQYRKSRKVSLETISRIEQMRENIRGLRAILLTLTVPNCAIKDLNETVKKMSKAFDNFMKRKNIKKVCLGYVRALELFGDHTKVGEAHPHYHILFLVKHSYFGSRDYLTQKDFSKLWTDCYKSPVNLVVDVRKIKAKKVKVNDEKSVERDAFTSSILEVCKYSLKASSISAQSDDDIKELLKQTSHIRSYAISESILQYKPKLEELDLSVWHYVCDEYFRYNKKEQVYNYLRSEINLDQQ